MIERKVFLSHLNLRLSKVYLILMFCKFDLKFSYFLQHYENHWAKKTFSHFISALKGYLEHIMHQMYVCN